MHPNLRELSSHAFLSFISFHFSFQAICGSLYACRSFLFAQTFVTLISLKQPSPRTASEKSTFKCADIRIHSFLR